jgi:gamma-glutamyltranspeptidase/glutathione hydrolase
VIRRPGVARALDAIVSDGRAGFYEGEFGEGLLKLGNGEYAAADLASPGARWVDPISVEAFGHILWGIPPSSQGYLLLSSAWIADGLPLPDDPDDPLWRTCSSRRRGKQAMTGPLLHDAATAAARAQTPRPRRAAIDPERASTLRAGARAGDTTALCVVDGDGVGVSLIQSNASGFGCHVFEPNTGIGLHNRGIGFTLEPGHPAEYGPGRRPPHTLTPDGHRPRRPARRCSARWAAISQPQILLQILARTFGLGESPSRAIADRLWPRSRPRAAIWTDRRTAVALEGHAPPSWAGGLAARGHDVATTAAFDHGFGHAHLIVVEDGHLAGAADPRARTGLCSGL